MSESPPRKEQARVVPGSLNLDFTRRLEPKLAPPVVLIKRNGQSADGFSLPGTAHPCGSGCERKN
jgi:hypothetical protein